MEYMLVEITRTVREAPVSQVLSPSEIIPREIRLLEVVLVHHFCEKWLNFIIKSVLVEMESVRITTQRCAIHDFLLKMSKKSLKFRGGRDRSKIWNSFLHHFMQNMHVLLNEISPNSKFAFGKFALLYLFCQWATQNFYSDMLLSLIDRFFAKLSIFITYIAKKGCNFQNIGYFEKNIRGSTTGILLQPKYQLEKKSNQPTIEAAPMVQKSGA